MMIETVQHRSRGISLHSLFSSARMIHADDIYAVTCCNSAEQCQPGNVYVIPPTEDNPEEAAAKAVARGVSGIVSERMLPFPIPQCLVPDTVWAYSQICDRLADQPGKQLLTIGVVGGNGKSSAVASIACILRQQGVRSAYYCDLGSSDGITQGLSAARSADVGQILEWLNDARDAKAAAAIIELTPAMLRDHHAAPLHLDLLVVTDGTDLKTVQMATNVLSESGAVVGNLDCPKLAHWLDRLERPVLRYGFDPDADVIGNIFRQQLGEMTMLVTAGDTTQAMHTKLTGQCMAQAQLAAIAVGLLVGGSLQDCTNALTRLTRITGRQHRLPSVTGAAVFIDSANNAVRLRGLLKSLRSEVSGRITAIIMLPVGGAPEERAMLARVAERFAHKVVFTSFPGHRRSFLSKVHDALDGVEHPERMHWIAGLDQAIEHGCKFSGDGDAVAVICPQENREFTVHHELLENIAKLVNRREESPQNHAHPRLATVS